MSHEFNYRGLLARLAAAAVVAVAAGSGPVFAEAPFVASPTDSSGLLQSEMRDRDMGGSQLDDNGLTLRGYAEAGYVFNCDDPPQGDMGIGRIFDSKSEDPMLNQVSLILSRDALLSPTRFDMGFKVQGIYGSDVRYIQANGTNFYGSAVSPFVQRYPDEQFDFTQFYLTTNLPVGNGLLLTGGKFVAPWGIEKIDPTQNILFSHTYTFSLSTPKTLTGLTASYQLNDEWKVMGGIVVGWDQALKDNNDFPSFLVQGSYQYTKDVEIVLTGIFGPEQSGNRSNYRWLFDGTVTCKMPYNTDLAAEMVMGYEPDVGSGVRQVPALDQNGNPIINPGTGQPFFVPRFVLTGDDAFWFGTSVYSSTRIDDDGMWTLNFRGEYFNDNAGAHFLATEIYSGSVGLTIVPFIHDKIAKNLMIRPEVRYDWSIDKIYDGGSRDNQISLGVDVIFQF